MKYVSNIIFNSFGHISVLELKKQNNKNLSFCLSLDRKNPEVVTQKTPIFPALVL